MATTNKIGGMQINLKKRKLMSDNSDDSSDSRKYVLSQNKRTHRDDAEFKSNKSSKKIKNQQKLEILFQTNDEYYSEKSLRKIVPNEKKMDHNDNEIQKDKNEGKEIELQVWHYLLHHLEDSEKLIALKLLLGISKMKQNWEKNFLQSKYEDTKVVKDLKLVIKTLKHEQEENEKERQILLKKNSELKQQLSGERKCRIQLAEALANTCTRYKSIVENTKCVGIKTQNEIKHQQISNVTKIATDKNHQPVPNSNDKIIEIKKELMVEQDLRNVLNNRENGGNRENRNNCNSLFSPIACSVVSYPHSYGVRDNHRIIDDELSLIIKSQNFRQTFSQTVKIMEFKMKMPLHFNRVIPYTDYWVVQCMSLADKVRILNRKHLLKGTTVLITDDCKV